MNKTVKFIGNVAASAILAASLSITSFAAAPTGQLQGGAPRQQMQGPAQSKNGNTNAANGEAPSGIEGTLPEMPQGERPEKSQGEMPQGEKPEGEMPQGEKPEGEMPQGEKPEGEMPQGEMPDGEEPMGEKPEGEKPAPDSAEELEALLETIEGLEDEDLQSSLLDLYNAYVEAANAGKEALESEDADEDALKELMDAEMEARDALIDALIEAGIDLEDVELFQRPDGEVPEDEGLKEIDESQSPTMEKPPVNEDGSAAVSTDNDNIFTKIGNTVKSRFVKIGSFFKKLFND